MGTCWLCLALKPGRSCCFWSPILGSRPGPEAEVHPAWSCRPQGSLPFSALSCCSASGTRHLSPPWLLEASAQPWLFPTGKSGRDGQDAPNRAQSTRRLHPNPAADRPPAVSSEQGPQDTGAWAPPPPTTAPALGAVRATSVPGRVLPAGAGRCEGRGTACRGGVDAPRGKACALRPESTHSAHGWHS